jgi:hypothetical protein
MSITEIGGTTVTLELIAKWLKYIRNISLSWIHGTEQTAPAANTNLVTKVVGSGKVGYIYGILITASEANKFTLNWTSGGAAKSISFQLSARGTLLYVFWVPLNEGSPADSGTSITIKNVTAGTSGSTYQAGFLYGEI